MPMQSVTVEVEAKVDTCARCGTAERRPVKLVDGHDWGTYQLVYGDAPAGWTFWRGASHDERGHGGRRFSLCVPCTERASRALELLPESK